MQITDHTQAPVFEIFPHKPDEWRRHGAPVELKFGDDDERPTSTGSLYLDLPNEGLHFPCYALFLDPGNAIVLQTLPGPPEIAPGEVPGNWDANNLSDILLTTADVVKQVKQQPSMKGWVMQAIVNTRRIGVACFKKGYKPTGEETKPVDVSNLTLEDTDHARPDKSRGPVSEDDPKVRVTIL